MKETIYLDSDFICHRTGDDTMIQVETDFFVGKCDTFVEGHRLVPEGQAWTREDGAVFRGQMVSPWRDYGLLAAAQAQYERDHDELVAAYQEGVNSV